MARAESFGRWCEPGTCVGHVAKCEVQREKSKVSSPKFKEKRSGGYGRWDVVSLWPVIGHSAFEGLGEGAHRGLAGVRRLCFTYAVARSSGDVWVAGASRRDVLTR